MFQELSKLYTEIVERTITVLPENWKTFWIRAECEESTWGDSGYYELQDDDEVFAFFAPSEATKLIHETWNVSRVHNDNWTTILLKVSAPGDLHITLGHEDLADEAVTPTDRVKIFKERTFPGRKVTSTHDWSGAISLTPEMLKSGEFQPNP